ncbi:hypothetical protein [Kitasatospora sp. GAS1066B]|uniref:hypothetical protein n=1 Tax=Kitasatospora sp. GAS1066B TaxID=3156271 RepID=UPI0035144DC2
MDLPVECHSRTSDPYTIELRWFIALHDRSGCTALLTEPTDDLDHFPDRCYTAVPAGTEHRHADWDRCIGRLLGRDPGWPEDSTPTACPRTGPVIRPPRES